jgi:hypothetical protein
LETSSKIVKRYFEETDLASRASNAIDENQNGKCFTEAIETKAPCVLFTRGEDNSERCLLEKIDEEKFDTGTFLTFKNSREGWTISLILKERRNNPKMIFTKSIKPLEAQLLQEQKDEFERKLLTSKLKSLEDHISNLIQKKIRIDLEIKRTKKKLTKLRQSSVTYVRTKVELEESLDLFDDEDSKLFYLEESVGHEVLQELIQLDELIDQAIELEREIDELPLAE